MPFTDYYQLLQVSTDASSADIKQAYKQLALKLHPDVNPQNSTAAEQFRLLNEAYAVLSAEETRKQYDTYGQFWKVAAAMDKSKKQREDLPTASGRRGFFKKLWRDQFGG